MRTATSISPLKASKLLGVAKTTITRAIKDGKLAAFRALDGRLWIEPSELSRAFPEVTDVARAPMRDTSDATSGTGSALGAKLLQGVAEDGFCTDAQQRDVDALRRELTDLARQRDAAHAGLQQAQEERERERRQLEETVSDLRGRLDTSEVERRQMTERVTALLTDRRDAANTKPRRWWRRRVD